MKLSKLLILIIWFLLQSCVGQIPKINGVSYVAARHEISEVHVNPVININANYAAVMPFGFIRDLKNPNIVYNTERQWFGETSEGVKQYVSELEKKGISIMLKPQIWVWRGEFTGYIEMENEENWIALENSYSEFILEYASLAEEIKADIFCVGTELEKFIENRPKFWIDLITEIKSVYSGKLTYAANWDEFKRTPFWSELDFIGVDAYFPVSNEQTPSVEDCIEGWTEHKNVIKSISDKYDLPILFTEFGYRSVDYSGKEPWQSSRDMGDVNLIAQNNATEAIFKTFWNEDWFAGGFLWKWFTFHDEVGGEDNPMFTPQNKPVEQIIKTYYKQE